jgi:hypothetical protein
MILVTLAVLVMTAIYHPVGLNQTASAGGKSPYESGYNHGCDDADISDPDDRYINQP